MHLSRDERLLRARPSHDVGPPRARVVLLAIRSSNAARQIGGSVATPSDLADFDHSFGATISASRRAAYGPIVRDAFMRLNVHPPSTLSGNHRWLWLCGSKRRQRLRTQPRVRGGPACRRRSGSRAVVGSLGCSRQTAGRCRHRREARVTRAIRRVVRAVCDADRGGPSIR
jgi:hypothetical protein